MILEVYLITYLSLIYTTSLDVCASLYALYGPCENQCFADDTDRNQSLLEFRLLLIGWYKY